MKKKTALALCAAAMVLASCSGGKVKEGHYEGASDGYGGPISVSLDVDANGVITDAKVVSHSETPEIGGLALEVLVKETLAKGSSEINAVSGATSTSNGYVNALNVAMKGDRAKLRDLPETEAETETETEAATEAATEAQTEAVTEAATSGTGTATEGGLNIRKEPNVNSTSVGKLTKGATVTVSGMEADAEGKKWYKITTPSGTEGYVSADFMTVEAAAEETSETVASQAETEAATEAATEAQTNE